MNRPTVRHAAGAGALSGFVATLPMTIVMLLLQRLLPDREQHPLPPEQMADQLASASSKVKRTTTEVRRIVAIPLHFGFGAVAGVLFGVSVGRTRVSPVASAIPFALLVWVVSYLGWVPAARILPPATEQPMGRNALMIVAHVVWGAVTGACFRAFTSR